jgi:hypothetical protein
MPTEREIRVLTGADVRALLPMVDCIDRMAEALAELARGESRCRSGS